MSEVEYRSKIGGWFYIAPILMALVVIVWYQFRHSLIVAVLCIVALVALLFVLVASLYMYKETHYTITDSSVRVKAPGNMIDIDFEKITSVDTERDNDALYYGMSNDVVRINFGTISSVVISPKKKGKFMDELRARDLKVEE
ncbi:MAG TPA: PH domain-containing protein [Candidatus Methanomethylophilaceae archaeon]|nr:PH domain-containing protein [Candidatus Methanomethylophilaceae archaeon]